MIVVDASVAVKWYVRESLTDQAIAFYAENQGELAAPQIFVVEVISTLVRRANVEKSFRRDSEKSIRNLLQLLDVGLIEANETSPEQLGRAAKLALDLGHPLKDCIYLALAKELGCPLVTADVRFAEKAEGIYGDVRILGA